MELRSVKIRVKNKTDSVNFQKSVFESGGEWGDGGQDVKRTNKPFLFVNADGKMTYQDAKAEPFFDEHRYIDVTRSIVRGK